MQPCNMRSLKLTGAGRPRGPDSRNCTSARCLLHTAWCRAVTRIERSCDLRMLMQHSLPHLAHSRRARHQKRQPIKTAARALTPRRDGNHHITWLCPTPPAAPPPPAAYTTTGHRRLLTCVRMGTRAGGVGVAAQGLTSRFAQSQYFYH